MPEDSTATDRANEPARVSMRQGFGGFGGSSSRRHSSDEDEEEPPKPERSSSREDVQEAAPEAETEAASSVEPAKSAASGKSATSSKKSAKPSQNESKSQDVRISLNLTSEEYDNLSDLHLAWLQNNRELAKQIGGMKHMTTFALACMQMGANLATSSEKWAKELQKHAPTRRRKGRG